MVQYLGVFVKQGFLSFVKTVFLIETIGGESGDIRKTPKKKKEKNQGSGGTYRSRENRNSASCYDCDSVRNRISDTV